VVSIVLGPVVQCSRRVRAETQTITSAEMFAASMFQKLDDNLFAMSTKYGPTPVDRASAADAKDEL